MCIAQRHSTKSFLCLSLSWTVISYSLVKTGFHVNSKTLCYAGYAFLAVTAVVALPSAGKGMLVQQYFVTYVNEQCTSHCPQLYVAIS